MNVDKSLATDGGEYFLNKESLVFITKRIRRHYDKKPTEKLVLGESGGKSKFEVYFSRGEGVIVNGFDEVDGNLIAGLKVTFRKQGDIRVDDPNQQTIAPAGILHTYYGVCDQEGNITFHSKNDKQSNPSHVDHLLNTNQWGGLDTKEIAERYREGVATAIRIFKNLPQT